MRKTINAKPVSEIEILFENDEPLLLRFDTEAIFRVNDLEGGINSLLKETSMSEMCAKIIYIGGVSNNSGLTLEKARMITSNLSIETVTEIMAEFENSMGTGKNEVQKELQKKLMEQFLANWK